MLHRYLQVDPPFEAIVDYWKCHPQEVSRRLRFNPIQRRPQKVHPNWYCSQKLGNGRRNY